MAVQNSTVKSHSSTLALKGVFGEGRKGRWDSVKTIVNEHIVPLWGSQEKLLKKVQERKEYKCRLLYEGEKPIGVLIYKEELSQLKTGNCLKAKIFYAPDFSKEKSDMRYSTFLLDELKKIAKDLKAESITIPIASNIDHVVDFFSRDFKKILTDKKGALWERAFGKPIQKKRKDRDGKEEIEMSKKQKPFPTENNFPISGGKAEKIEQPKTKTVPQIPIKGNYFGDIKSGRKTVEGRINSWIFAKLRENEEIDFINGPDKVRCQIVKINKYNSFQKMLEKETVKACLPDVQSLDEAVKIYHQIPGYREKAERFGVVAIQIKITKT